MRKQLVGSRKNGIWSRPLGGRSILGDPSRNMQKNLNLKVK